MRKSQVPINADVEGTWYAKVDQVSWLCLAPVPRLPRGIPFGSSVESEEKIKELFRNSRLSFVHLIIEGLRLSRKVKTH